MEHPKLPSKAAPIRRLAGETVETLVEISQGGGIHFLHGETVTVSSAVRSTGDWIPGDLSQLDLVAVVFQLVSGGPIEILVEEGINASAGGANGEFQRQVLDVWKVTGRTDISNFTAIRSTGGTDAEIRAEAFIHDIAPAPD